LHIGVCGGTRQSDHANRVTTDHPVWRDLLAMTTTTTGAAEQRRAGIDRRTVGPAMLVLALAALMGVALPSVDRATSYHDQVASGDVAQIADGLTLVPATGWDLATGALVGHTRSSVGTTATTEVTDGGVELQVQTAPFDGTPSALLARVNRINTDLGRLKGGAAATTRHYAVTTRQGAPGVAEDFVGAHRQGTIATFVFPVRSQGEVARVGVEVVAAGPKDSISRRRDAIVEMIRSIRRSS
jgi:hypothetical protein